MMYLTERLKQTVFKPHLWNFMYPRSDLVRFGVCGLHIFVASEMLQVQFQLETSSINFCQIKHAEHVPL